MSTASPLFQRADEQRFIFTGSGRDYFGVWVVNLTLSVLTLGVYSAWAKVRRLQYFHRHTRLAGSAFDYHGSPFAILCGRIVALSLIAIYTFAGYARPFVRVMAFGLLALVLPWLLARSLRFRYFNTSYRGLRFRFCGSTAQAYWVFLVLPLLSVFSLFLLVPFCHHRIKRYQIGNIAFGTTKFRFDVPVADFYRIYLVAIGLLVILGISAALVMLLVAALSRGASGLGEQAAALTRTTTQLVAYALALLSVRAYFDARLRALVWAHTDVGRQRLLFFMEPGGLFLLNGSNLLATLLTLGFYVPFAQVRRARYVASMMWITSNGDLDCHSAGIDQTTSAVGDESVGLFDLDVAI